MVITTKNRKDDLHRAIASALAQTADIEILVVDDGSDDGTAEMVRAEFPAVRLYRSEQSEGLIKQRNRAARLASSPFIFSIDDDAAFSSPNIVAETLAEFDHPRIGAVAIPYIDVCRSDTVNQQAPDAPGRYVTYSYIGTAHALRRDLFLKLHGYRPFLVHQGEERDYCVRMLDLGYVVRLGRAAPIHHFESPRRDLKRQTIYGWRNNVLYAWYNVPMPDLPAHLAGMTFRAIVSALNSIHGRPRHVLWGLLRGYGDCLRQLKQRDPVSRQTYRLSQKLKRPGGVPLRDVEPQLSNLFA